MELIVIMFFCVVLGGNFAMSPHPAEHAMGQGMLVVSVPLLVFSIFLVLLYENPDKR